MSIETFVFFDIETTGLPHFERNRTKITELAFVVASRQDIQTCPTLPLVNKLAYVFNPEKKIHPDAEKITGLSYSKLKNQQTFKQRIESLNSFLGQLPKPVCLIAHNGNRFDFKILKTEYEDAGKDLPSHLLCLDSLAGFRKIMKDNIICNDNFKPQNETVDDLLTDDEDWPELNTSAEEWDEIDRLTESFTNMSPISNNISKTVCSPGKKEEKMSFKLTEIYKKLFNRYPKESHRAEDDCMTLLQCVVAMRKHFLPWADKNCKLLSEITTFVRR